MKPIVLASGSEYRAELLRKLHFDFAACSSHIDETALPGETAEQLVVRLAQNKAKAVSASYPNHLIIGSDQVAVCGTQFLNKPGNREQAIRQLKKQSGQAVRFYTGLSVLNSSNGNILSDMDICTVYFRPLSDRQIEHYIDLEQPFDCAGSFKSEGLGIALFSKIKGADPNALIGLPLIKLIDLFAQFGVDIL